MTTSISISGHPESEITFSGRLSPGSSKISGLITQYTTEINPAQRLNQAHLRSIVTRTIDGKRSTELPLKVNLKINGEQVPADMNTSTYRLGTGDEATILVSGGGVEENLVPFITVRRL